MSLYRPERAILELDSRFYTEVEPADFPRHTLRWRNQRWAERVGLDGLGDDDWINHFGKFHPLPGSLAKPLALAYHGHQFRVYNPQLGDGRGFLFAQLRDDKSRLLDLGTKGSGQTPWSRRGDGRLTLKGGVREILAAGMLEALGVYTSKAFSLIETGEQLHRGDEPSPTRSSVLVRLSHSHVRFGTFQRLAHAGDSEGVAHLVDYCVRHFHPAAASGDMASRAAGLLREVVFASADLAAAWMASGFVHGVLNTDNMVVTGESFDYGPWRFLPYSDPSFTAAYFDDTGLYAFGRQPSAVLWNLSQLANCLTLVAEPADLEVELNRYEAAYREAFPRRVLSVLGLKADRPDKAVDLMKVLFHWMGANHATWPQVFFDWFGGEASAERARASPLAGLYASSDFESVQEMLGAHQPDRPERLAHPYFRGETPASLLIEEVEALWDRIADDDDWGPFYSQMERIDMARQALCLQAI